jgi:alkylation response protein AidB-like acyl-CoA dehydrogenase
MMTEANVPTMALLETPEEKEIRKSVRQICDSFGEQFSRERYNEGKPALELWDALSEAGFVSLNIAEEWGGGGMGMTGLSIVAEETARAGHSIVLLVVSSAINGSIISAHGSEEQKKRWLPGIVDGSWPLAFAITEPDAGSNSHNLSTVLERDGDGYRLSGQKVFISGFESSKGLLVVARLRGEDGKLGVPCLCLIDSDSEGVSGQPIPMPYIGADQQWQLFFDNVHVDADRIIGGETGGLKAVFDGLNPERLIIAAMETGIGLRGLEKGSAYAKERTVWKAPIGTHQGVAHRLASGKVEVEMARLMTKKAAALYDYDRSLPEVGEAANLAKYKAAEAAIESVDAAIQTHGGNGFAIEYGASDLWWQARLMRAAPVSSDMILNFVSEHMLGLPKSY